MPNASDYQSGFGLGADSLFDIERTRRLFSSKWFFAGTRGDVAQPGDVFTFRLLEDSYFLVHCDDGVIRCMVNRCAHQSARLFNDVTGRCGASIVCPNHQWSYHSKSGKLRAAPAMGREFVDTAVGQRSNLTSIETTEIAGMIFACLGNGPESDSREMRDVLAPYTDPFSLDGGVYKLASHYREIVDANWLLVMINNRECLHCRTNHKGLCKLFDPSSFNGAMTPRYAELFDSAVVRWEGLGLEWQEQAFAPNDCARVARYPMQPGFRSITFDGQPACAKPIGPFAKSGDYDESTLSMWFNPNAWVHFTSDHIATNWVLPIDDSSCELYTSWIVRADAEEGVDYQIDHLEDVWRVTNAEDVGLCMSMTAGARSAHYRPGPFSPDERFCTQFCDWFMHHSS